MADVALPRLSVEQAYAEVQRITRRRARNFAYGIMVLPGAKRRAIAAIYAFARLVDDIADGDLPPLQKGEQLEELHGKLDAPAEGDALWVALADARTRYPISSRSLHDLVDGGLQDLTQTRYANFDELAGYCRRVAGAVGIACTAVYGADPAGAVAARPGNRTGGGAVGEPGGSPIEDRAQALGIALQLINIIRDVAEDLELGRVYLPQDELASFGVVEDDIAAGRCTPSWQALMAYQAARARTHLDEGLTLLDYLDRRSSACVATFAGLYRATLDRIEGAGFDVFAGPPQLSPLTKLRIVASALL